MTEQTLSAHSGGKLFVFTPLGIIEIGGSNLRKIKFTLPPGMQAFRLDKLERMKKELTLVTEETHGETGKKGFVPAFKFLVPMIDKDGFLVGVASAADATFVLVDEPTMPQPETESDMGDLNIKEPENVSTQT
jgi:hypothetical protein